jgi:hypothetical protein
VNRRRAVLGAGAAAALFGAALARAAEAGYAAADLQHARRLIDRGLADGTAWSLVESLTTEVGARPAGSEADTRAAAWAQAAIRRLGLTNVRAEELPIRVWQRGSATARLLQPYAHSLVIASLGNSVGTAPDGLAAELAYFPDLAALRADTSDRARGRIAFIDQPTERTRDGRGYGRAVAARVEGAIEAARRGALGLGIRSISTARDRVAHTGAMRYDLSVPRIPAFAVSVPDAELIARLHARGAVPRLQLAMNNHSEVDATTRNVIGEVAGGELAQEIVLIGAHLDSWDLGQGALDNGAGVAIVSAAAALIASAGARPRRTIRVVLFGNEENGFDGARAYGDRYRDTAHQLVAESDFGSGRVWRLRSRVRRDALPLIDALAALLKPLGIARPADAANEGTPGPDAALLMRRHRWPAIELTQDGTHYFDVHHTENDTLDKVDRDALPANTAAWAAVLWLAAQAPHAFGPLEAPAA